MPLCGNPAMSMSATEECSMITTDMLQLCSTPTLLDAGVPEVRSMILVHNALVTPEFVSQADSTTLFLMESLQLPCLLLLYSEYDLANIEKCPHLNFQLKRIKLHSHYEIN